MLAKTGMHVCMNLCVVCVCVCAGGAHGVTFVQGDAFQCIRAGWCLCMCERAWVRAQISWLARMQVCAVVCVCEHVGARWMFWGQLICRAPIDYLNYHSCSCQTSDFELFLCTGNREHVCYGKYLASFQVQGNMNTINIQVGVKRNIRHQWWKIEWNNNIVYWENVGNLSVAGMIKMWWI